MSNRILSNDKSRSLLTIACLVAFALSTAESKASIFVTDLINGSNPLPISGNQPWAGQLGDDFTTTAELVIRTIGVFDSGGNGTTVPLTWRLYEVGSGSLVEEVIVPPSPASGLSGVESNYIFVDLLSSIVLAANTTYSVVASGFGVGNQNFNTNFNLSTNDVDFNTEGLIAAGGRYSNTAAVGLPTLGAGNSASSTAYNFGAGTFVYEVAPEPYSFAVWSLMSLGGIFACRRR